MASVDGLVNKLPPAVCESKSGGLVMDLCSDCEGDGFSPPAPKRVKWRDLLPGSTISDIMEGKLSLGGPPRFALASRFKTSHCDEHDTLASSAEETTKGMAASEEDGRLGALQRGHHDDN